jgi:NAD(P)-dependent dehydrogenase (short-subunit alcohol dehydrogenase family)
LVTHVGFFVTILLFFGLIRYWTAITAVNKGAECVMMLNRNSSRADSAQDAVSKIAAEAGGRTKVVTISCDLQSFASVREAAAEVTKTAAKYGGLDGLLNNAGIMGMPDKRTDDGYDCQMQTNHLSHFLLTSLVMGSLNDAAAVRGESRVVQHSSGARGVKIIPIPGDGNLEAKYMQKSAAGELGGDDVMGSFTRYHQTKLANTVYCMTLHEKLTTAGSKVKSVCCEPGTCDTSLAGNLMNA